MKLNLKLLNRFCVIFVFIILSVLVSCGCRTGIKPITKFEKKELPKEISRPLHLIIIVDAQAMLGMFGNYGYSFVDSGNDFFTVSWSNAQSSFSKFFPKLYSDATTTIPIVVKMSVGHDTGCSLHQIWLSIQLSPGKYSSPISMDFIEYSPPAEQLRGVWTYIQKEGRPPKKYFFINWVFGYFYEENEDFIKMISDGIVECLNQLSSKEIELVLNNPQAWQYYQDINPFAKSHFSGGTHDVLIDVASEESQPMKAEIVETEYNESSGRGSVVIFVGNTDRILLLKWVKDEVLPGLLGQNKSIRIVGEETLSNQKIKFKFEVIE